MTSSADEDDHGHAEDETDPNLSDDGTGEGVVASNDGVGEDAFVERDSSVRIRVNSNSKRRSKKSGAHPGHAEDGEDGQLDSDDPRVQLEQVELRQSAVELDVTADR